MKDFQYGETDCHPALLPWIWNYWEFRVQGAGKQSLPHHVPPDGCVSIAFIGGGQAGGMVVASGPWLEPFVVPVRPGSVYRGLRCRPEAGALLLGTTADRLVNRSQPVALFAPDLAEQLSHGLAGTGSLPEAAGVMDRLLVARMAGATRPDQAVRQAVDAIIRARGELILDSLGSLSGLSPRTLRRRFRAATGLAPKQFARICRFRYAASSVLSGRPRWAAVASDSGFADQPHMIHEFRDLLGLSPASFEDQADRTDHGTLVP